MTAIAMSAISLIVRAICTGLFLAAVLIWAYEATGGV